MSEVKQVVQWKPVRVEINDKGKVGYIGKFRTKVPQGTPGATHQKGSNPAGKTWDYWAQDVDSVPGHLRWLDVRTSDYGPTIALFIESPKALHQISIPYDVNSIHTVMNHFLGLGKELEVAYLNVSYWVRKKTDANKNVKLDKDGNPIWAKDISFRDVPVKWDFEQWKAFSEKNDLQWFQEKRGLDKIWNFEAELNFWMKQVVKVQRFLLSTEKCLPFTWNSVTASASDGTELTLTSDEIATCKSIYEAVKPMYNFGYRQQTNADDIALAPASDYDYNNAAHVAEPFSVSNGNAKQVSVPSENDFPTQDITSYPENGDDPLPF